MNTLRSLTPHRYRSRHTGATRGSGLSRIVCLVALFVIFAASMRAQYPVTPSSFPDKNFYSVVLKNYSMFNGTYYQTVSVPAMDVKSCNIADLTGIGLFPILQTLDCSNNQLTSVNLSYNAILTTVTIYKNKLRGTNMDNFISNLFDRSGQATKGELRIIYNEDASTGNQMTTEQVAAAKKKGWTPKQSTNGTTWTDYPGVVLINSKNFPDSKFQAWLKTKTYGQDGVLTPSEIAGVTSIDVRDEAISDLTGINYFTALTELDCSFNKLTTLDVSKNTALTELGCSYNQLTNLDVSGCTALTKLACYNNQLTNLDVSKNTALTELDCSSNQLTNLDVSGCTALTELDCCGNQLTNLDVSKNTALTELVCSYNQLTDLDVSKNTKLTELYCSGNQLTDLDVSKNTALTELNCSSNQLTDLDVSDCTALTELYCGGNQLSDLDVSKNTALTELGCNNNQLHGAAVNKLINSLPETTEAALYFYYNEKPDGNEITTAQVAAAKKEKGWTTYYWNNSIYNWLPYEGISITAGDLNNDSKIDAADVALLISYLTNPEAFEGEELALDVNADGVVDDKDLDELVNNILK